MTADIDVSTGTAETTTEGRAVERYETGGEWQAGVLGGLLGGVAMAVVWSLRSPGVLEAAIPALVGLSGGVAGWVVHLSISAVFGVVFAALLARRSLRPYGERVGSATAAGLAYGVVLWLVAAGVVMPLWLDAVGFAGAPPLPNLAILGLVTHLLYGLLLGASYPALVRTFRPSDRDAATA